MARPLPELRDYRTKHGLTCRDMGERLGVSDATISRWENGERSPDRQYIPVLAELTGVDPLEIAGIGA